MTFDAIVRNVTKGRVLSLSPEELLKLEELKQRIIIHLTAVWMKDDCILFVFLRDAGFDVEKAEQKLLNFIKVRKDKGIDAVVNEIFPQFDGIHKATLQGVDREGFPVISASIKDWVINPKQKEHFIRYFYKVVEGALMSMGNLSRKEEEMHEMKITVVVDLEGMSLWKQASPSCIPIYLEMVSYSQQFFLGFLNKVHILNAPSFVPPMWSALKSFYTGSLTERMIFYGGAKEKQLKEINTSICSSQLSSEFGGERAGSCISFGGNASERI